VFRGNVTSLGRRKSVVLPFLMEGGLLGHVGRPHDPPRASIVRLEDADLRGAVWGAQTRSPCKSAAPGTVSSTFDFLGVIRPVAAP